MSELKTFDIVVAEEGYCEGIVKYRRAVYDKSEADKVIAELEESHKKEVEQLLMEIVELKAKLGAVNELVKESKELLKESQRMHQRCADNASKQIRRLKRALYKACANWADVEVFERTIGIDDPNVEAHRWALMRNKCLKKVEEFK